MRIIPTTTGIDEAVKHLRSGGLVIHPTETCYGIACDLSNHDAVRRLFVFKRRPEAQPVSALFADIDMAGRYVEWVHGALEKAKKDLPGPLTLVVPIRTNAPHSLYPLPMKKGENIGVRISPNRVATEIVTRFGRPISTTSANLHGQPNPYSAEQIVTQFEGSDSEDVLLLDAGKLPEAPPSTVMIWKDNAWTVVRQGNVR